MIKAKHIAWALAASVAVLAAGVLGACDTNSAPQPPLVVCETWQAPDGTWMERDNEPVDDDPCDLEADVHFPVIKPSTKKPSPVAKSTPIGGRKKRF